MRPRCSCCRHRGPRSRSGLKPCTHHAVAAARRGAVSVSSSLPSSQRSPSSSTPSWFALVASRAAHRPSATPNPQATSQNRAPIAAERPRLPSSPTRKSMEHNRGSIHHARQLALFIKQSTCRSGGGHGLGKRSALSCVINGAVGSTSTIARSSAKPSSLVDLHSSTLPQQYTAARLQQRLLGRHRHLRPAARSHDIFQGGRIPPQRIVLQD